MMLVISTSTAAMMMSAMLPFSRSFSAVMFLKGLFTVYSSSRASRWFKRVQVALKRWFKRGSKGSRVFVFVARRAFRRCHSTVSYERSEFTSLDG